MPKTAPESVWMRRNGDSVETNVPHDIVLHSPTGLEWGYAGSGPSDMALNILALYTDEDTAMRLHQDFKRAYIVNMPDEGGEITREQIEHWLAHVEL